MSRRCPERVHGKSPSRRAASPLQSHRIRRGLLGCLIGGVVLGAGSAYAHAAGKALSFDGVDDRGTVADADVFSPSVNDLTISFWAKIPTTAPAKGDGACARAGSYLLAKGASNAWEWGIENDRNTLLCFTAWQLNSNSHGSITHNFSLNDGQWHHYAFTLDYGVKWVLYIDSVAKSSLASFTGTMGNGSQPVLVGGRSDGNWFAGVVDEMRIVTRALTASEVVAEYNNGIGTYGAAGTGVVGAWHLDEGTGTPADYSGNGRSITLSGGVAWVDGFIAPPGGGSLPTITSVQVAPSARLYPAQAATITAAASGTGTGLQYQFLIDTTIIRDWATGNSTAWTPSTGSLGQRALTVKARDSNGTSTTSKTLLVIRQPLRPQ